MGCFPAVRIHYSLCTPLLQTLIIQIAGFFPCFFNKLVAVVWRFSRPAPPDTDSSTPRLWIGFRKNWSKYCFSSRSRSQNREQGLCQMSCVALRWGCHCYRYWPPFLWYGWLVVSKIKDIDCAQGMEGQSNNFLHPNMLVSLSSYR